VAALYAVPEVSTPSYVHGCARIKDIDSWVLTTLGDIARLALAGGQTEKLDEKCVENYA